VERRDCETFRGFVNVGAMGCLFSGTSARVAGAGVVGVL
jgi:hypothetical protein